MNSSSTYPLRLPKSLKDGVTRLARRDGASLNQFIAIAVAEKVSAMETEQYFAERAKRADPDTFLAILSRKGGEPPRQGDAFAGR